MSSRRGSLNTSDTLLLIAKFHITGTPTGDGGDQYEKGIKLIKQLLDAGGGERWPQLYLWGAICAYCTNDFDLSGEYFTKWKAAQGADPQLMLRWSNDGGQTWGN